MFTSLVLVAGALVVSSANIHYHNDVQGEYAAHDAAIMVGNATQGVGTGSLGYELRQHGRQQNYPTYDRMNRYRQLLPPSVMQQSGYQSSANQPELSFPKYPPSMGLGDSAREVPRSPTFDIDQTVANVNPKQTSNRKPAPGGGGGGGGGGGNKPPSEDDDSTTMIIAGSIVGFFLFLIIAMISCLSCCFILYIFFCCCCKKKSGGQENQCCEPSDCCNTPCGSGTSCGSGSPMPSHRFRSSVLRDAGGGRRYDDRYAGTASAKRGSSPASQSEMSKDDWDVSYVAQGPSTRVGPHGSQSQPNKNKIEQMS